MITAWRLCEHCEGTLCHIHRLVRRRHRMVMASYYTLLVGVFKSIATAWYREPIEFQAVSLRLMAKKLGAQNTRHKQVVCTTTQQPYRSHTAVTQQPHASHMPPTYHPHTTHIPTTQQPRSSDTSTTQHPHSSCTAATQGARCTQSRVTNVWP